MKEYLKQLAEEGRWEELQQILSEYKEYVKYNVIDFFEPYSYQSELFESGKDYTSRFACFSNRCG